MNSGGTAPEWGSVGSASSLSDGDSSLELADGLDNGLTFELDGTSASARNLAWSGECLPIYPSDQAAAA